MRTPRSSLTISKSSASAKPPTSGSSPATGVVYVSELAEYHRGRGPGEVHAVIRDELLSLGLDPENIEHHELELESFEAAMKWAGNGDLVIMLALGGAPPVYERIAALMRATDG